MFIVVLVALDRPKYPSVVEQKANCGIFIQWSTTLQRKGKAIDDLTTWMNQRSQIIILSEQSQARMSLYCVVQFILNSRKYKLNSSERKISDCLGEGREKGGRNYKEELEKFWR